MRARYAAILLALPLLAGCPQEQRTIRVVDAGQPCTKAEALDRQTAMDRDTGRGLLCQRTGSSRRPYAWLLPPGEGHP